ncbi:hypothetical protein Tco_0951742 [Tanacetum coccineum]|uniref:BZIP domain-containing protein n=1 Tax=Tanacetum coccineum TaxID=301880 RepID=A0ABQ5DVR8_9ASTR
MPAAALPSSPPPFPLTPLSSPLSQILSPPLLVPSPPLPLPSPPTHASPTFDEASQATEFKVGESSAAAAARQPGLDVATMDAIPGRPMSREDDRALQRARVNTLFRDRRYHLHTAVLVESEARCARQAWGQAMDCNRAVHAELQAYRAQVQTHETHIQTRDARTRSLETLVATLTLEAKEPACTEDPEDAGSSS